MKKVVIGDCELYLGDCMDILPNLPLTVTSSVLNEMISILILVSNVLKVNYENTYNLSQTKFQ